MSIKVTLNDEAAVLQAIRSVRNDTDSTNYVVVGHVNDDPNTLGLVASGAEGLEGIRAHLRDDQVLYSLLRITTKVDLSTTVKFVFIYHFGERISFVKKGRFGIVKGDAVKYFQPYHVDIEISSIEELLEEEILKKVQDAAGTFDRVHDADFVEGKQVRGYTSNMSSTTGLKAAPPSIPKTTQPVPVTPNSTPSFATDRKPAATAPRTAAKGPTVGVVATQSQGLNLTPQMTEAIQDVKNDKSKATWVVGSYIDGDLAKPIDLLASGEGEADDIRQHLDASAISYGLVRVTDVIDGHATIKFAFFSWIGPNVSIMKKAKIATHKGAVSEKFGPYHVDIVASELSEISHSRIMSKVQEASGSKAYRH
ncbi:uncharacterized protein BJ171DRAFT_488270 [Polychytrium aggregatum]|uniref:uncharacterized protein n=1 Tax=Polychytrium aggregatum TaxID=110093 RepID=UPI0022FEE1BF|nr:uncharacterized protein BJ171DRAFT_488270 [Polychytrium aggregatum]KAI9209038.1 hypothetical protein BJ171DRAFT_488270 [Polychytrium aggregatum]